MPVCYGTPCLYIMYPPFTLKQTNAMPTIEYHPLPPFTPGNARLLLLGSFPPPRPRWSIDFYYPNFQNDMWRIFGTAFFDDKDYFVDTAQRRFQEEKLRMFLSEKGIALCDTAHAVVRLKENASDKFLEIVEPVNLQALLDRIPLCHTIASTGEKSAETLCSIVGCETPAVGKFTKTEYAGRELSIYRMPSSSRAYPKPLADKAAVYSRLFSDAGLL